MSTQPISLRPKTPGLFVGLCSPCPRAPFCQKSAEQQCIVPETEFERELYWEAQAKRVRDVGGMEPRPLATLFVQPRLPKVTHIVQRSDKLDPREPRPSVLGVRASDVLGPLKSGLSVQRAKLARRDLLDVDKVLVITAKDDWLNGFVKFVDRPFARSVLQLNFSAVMGPNRSGYHHNEHSVWLDNRAICQTFMKLALEYGLPAIFHTYLEDSPAHQDWLVEYLRLNPSQKFIATGFDCNGTNNDRFVERRIQLLQEVESRVGRKLHVVLHTVMTNLRLIRYAHDAFPRRIYLLGQSVVRDSFMGTSLRFSPDGVSGRTYRDPKFKPGLTLFNWNSARLNDALARFVPGFFDDHDSNLLN